MPRRSQRLAQNSVQSGRPPVHPYMKTGKDNQWCMIRTRNIKVSNVPITKTANLGNNGFINWADLVN